MLGEDIFYKEGIIEILQKNKNVDILVLYEKLYGEISLCDLIKNIKKINNEIIIFIILKEKNNEINKFLEIQNIKNIYFMKEININKLISKLKNVKIENKNKLEEEIELLKNIISKKDEELLKYKNNRFGKLNNLRNKKLIVIVGEDKIGKTIILNNLKKIIKNNYEFEFKEININNFFEIEKLNNITYKFIFIFEMNLEKIKFNKTIINKLIMEDKINSTKINIIFNKINKYSINKKIAKNIFFEFRIIGNIPLNNYCDFSLNEKNNYKKENEKLKKQYLKIIKKMINNNQK